MGETKDCGFESQRHKLDETFSHLFVVKMRQLKIRARMSDRESWKNHFKSASHRRRAHRRVQRELRVRRAIHQSRAWRMSHKNSFKFCQRFHWRQFLYPTRSTYQPRWKSYLLSENTNLRGSTADLLFILFGFFGCFADVELATALLVWSNPNQSKRGSAIQWYFPPMVSVLCLLTNHWVSFAFYATLVSNGFKCSPLHHCTSLTM